VPVVLPDEPCRAWCCGPRGSSPRKTTSPEKREAFDEANLKVNELLYRRVDIEDVVSAHLCALDSRGTLGFGRLHHQRDDAVHAGTMRPAWAATRPACCCGTCPITRGIRGARLVDAARRWIASTTTSARAGC
jgi:hypothetical protein